MIENQIPDYHIKIKRGWFRGKEVFTDMLNVYERQFVSKSVVNPKLNAGNMIYIMMRRLEVGVDWDKQDALIESYRNLVYKLSYVDVRWHARRRGEIHMLGNKFDVMWAVSFLTQVFPEDAMECEVVPIETDEKEPVVQFQVQDGAYVGANAQQAQETNDEMPDIWAVKPPQDDVSADSPVYLTYSHHVRPQPGERFAIPDGRMADYVRMDERYYLAEGFGSKIGVVERHNISASIIKDFEDLIRLQTKTDYNTYMLRYTAFMNKVHELEHKMKGLEVSVYDILPVGERGLPYAPNDTVGRTNLMDQSSLRYIIDKCKRNKTGFGEKETEKVMKEASKSVLVRLRGYDLEYQMYQSTGSPEDLCRVIHDDKCFELYADFAELDALGLIPFPKKVYRELCNQPAGSAIQATDFERLKQRVFGRGYYDFLALQVQHVTHWKLKKIYDQAWLRLRRAMK